MTGPVPAPLAAATLALALGAGMAALRFRADMALARARLAGMARAPTRHGAIEYATLGAGAPVLVLHGAGGGADQGLAVAAPLATRGHRLIAVSRMGYLGSAPPPAGLPPAALAEVQAEAAAELLDRLGIARCAVAGLSAGAIPALAFARRFPARTRAVVLIVPVLRLPGAPPPLDWGPVQRGVAELLLRSDLLLWAALALARDYVFGRMMATDPALVRQAPAEERARLEALLATLLPVSARREGYLADAAAVVDAAAPGPLAIAAPLLALAPEDDRFGSAAIARGLAAALPQARLRSWPRGGHLAVGCAAAMLDAVAAFLAQHP